MSQDLIDEISAINSIYDPNTLTPSSDKDTYILSLPTQSISLRLELPSTYPSTPPIVLGTESALGEKGAGRRVANIVADVVGQVWQEGMVCLFEVIEEVERLLGEEQEHESEHVEPADGNEKGGEDAERWEYQDHEERKGQQSAVYNFEPPDWFVSEPAVEKKSVFIARAVAVTSVQQAEDFLGHLVDTDKKVAKATHNITAWKIRSGEVTYQDCDDDGESAAGGRLLKLMSTMDVWGVMVVVSRWYGGIKLGPDRFRLINQVAREALVKGGWTGEGEKDSKKKGKK